MNRFTKYTLLLGVLILTAAATASAVTYSYYRRGRFAIGGEWLIPAVVVLMWFIIREVKRILKNMKGKKNERNL